MVSPLAINPNTFAAGGNNAAGSLFPSSPTAGGNPFAALGSGPVNGQQNGFTGFASPTSAAAGNPMNSLGGSIGELASMLNTMMSGLMGMISQLLAGISNGSISGQAPAGSSGSLSGGSSSGGSGATSLSTSASHGSGDASGSDGGPTIGKGDVNTTDKMKKLAAAGKSAAMSMGGYNSQSLCATGVSKAISNALGISVSGNGNQIDDNLPKDKFKQVNMSLEEALKTPGLILTWEKTSTSAGSKYGHTAITLGDGKSSASDFIERDTAAASGGRSGLKIFMPV